MLSFLSIWTTGTATKQADGTNSEVEAPATGKNGTKDGATPSTSLPLARPEEVGASETASGKQEVPTKNETMNSSPLVAPDAERAFQPPTRFSFRSVAFFYGQKDTKVSMMNHEHDAKERRKATRAAKQADMSFYVFSRSTRSADKHAQRSAIAVQKLIVGPTTIFSTASKVPPVSKAQLTKIKSELMQPRSANRLIAKLKELPMPDGPVVGHTANGDATTEAKSSTPRLVVTKTSGPIHAVCLELTDAEMEAKHFSKLASVNVASDFLNEAAYAPSVASASLESLVPLFKDMHIIDLISSPDLGLGQPGDGKGILAGAVPTAETVINGALQITPQLMALGFATGKSIVPNHAGVYPPLDRISVITYWWGLEVCLPKATLKYLDAADNISHAVINLLTALSLMNNGVREILPFVRYISQFIDFEWNAIKAQDHGKGVVCAATWIMPAAMVPRPWDFLDKPAVGSAKPNGPSKAAEAPRTGQGVVEDIRVPPVMLPSLVVTPPSVIKNNGFPK